MATKDIKTRIQNKHDLEVNWNKATSFLPLPGELIIYDKEVDGNGNVLTKLINGVETPLLPDDRNIPYTYERFKIGDGVKFVWDLPFVSDPYYTRDEIDENSAMLQESINNLISYGTDDPTSETTGQFYFKYSE